MRSVDRKSRKSHDCNPKTSVQNLLRLENSRKIITKKHYRADWSIEWSQFAIATIASKRAGAGSSLVVWFLSATYDACGSAIWLYWSASSQLLRNKHSGEVSEMESKQRCSWILEAASMPSSCDCSIRKAQRVAPQGKFGLPYVMCPCILASIDSCCTAWYIVRSTSISISLMFLWMRPHSPEMLGTHKRTPSLPRRNQQ